MSSFLPLNENIIEGSEQFFSPIDPLDHESWLLYQELLECTTAADHDHDIINEGDVSNYDNLIMKNVDQTQLVVENGLESMKIVASPNSSTTKKNINRKMIDDENGEEGPSSVAKKLDHNAKERIRRMKINASFLALRALLPDSRRSKKRLGAPAVVDKVVKYIPEMENEVQTLRSKKESLQSKAKNKDEIIPTFLLNKVNEEEAIIQICMSREDYEDGLAFIRLMQSVEDEGILINSVSALYTSDTIICCHLHIQISDGTVGVDYIEQLRDKIISWLR